MTVSVKQLAGTVATIGLAVVGLQLTAVTTASAHTNSVSGSATCQQNGTYTVTWKISNDYADESETAKVVGFEPGSSTVSPSTLQLDKSANGTMTQTDVPGSTTSAKLTVEGTWDPDGVKQTVGGDVHLDGDCGNKQQVTSTSPTPHNGACVDYKRTTPGIDIPNTPGVGYQIDGRDVGSGRQSVSAGTHTVTAAGLKVDLVGVKSWSYTLSVAAGDCAVPRKVSPVSPAVRQSVCTGSGPTQPKLTTEQTTGVSYTVSSKAPYRAGETVTVTARADKGYQLGTLADGWRKRGDRAVYTATFAPSASCNGVDSDSASNSGTNSGGNGTLAANGERGGLANTGPQTGTMLFLGFGLVALGWALTFRGRRPASTR